MKLETSWIIVLYFCVCKEITNLSFTLKSKIRSSRFCFKFISNENCLKKFLTSDELWVNDYDPEIKNQSSQ